MLLANRFENRVTTLAWRNVRDIYRKLLLDKDFNRIIVSARPDNILNEIKK